MANITLQDERTQRLNTIPGKAEYYSREGEYYSRKEYYWKVDTTREGSIAQRGKPSEEIIPGVDIAHKTKSKILLILVINHH